MAIIRPGIGFVAPLNVAYGFQLFIEAQVLGAVTSGMIDSDSRPVAA